MPATRRPGPTVAALDRQNSTLFRLLDPSPDAKRRVSTYFERVVLRPSARKSADERTWNWPVDDTSSVGAFRGSGRKHVCGRSFRPGTTSSVLDSPAAAMAASFTQRVPPVLFARKALVGEVPSAAVHE